jgi:hypothetical protein
MEIFVTEKVREWDNMFSIHTDPEHVTFDSGDSKMKSDNKECF